MKDGLRWGAQALMVLVSAGMALSCGGGTDDTGASCEVADDCYPDIERDQIPGTVECLDRVPDGYCTHTCGADAECCSVEGECETDIPEVCAPFENSTVQRCFLSCEPDVVGDMDENDYCAEYAHESFICRSTGGGNQNRKVCVPNA